MPFGVLTNVRPVRLVFSFIFNQAACLLHPAKPYRGINFPYNTFFKTPQDYLRRLDYATVRRYQYSTIGHKITPILYSTYYRSINQDHDDHTHFTLAAFVTTHLQVGRLIRDTLV